MGNSDPLPLGPMPKGTELKLGHYPIEVIYTDSNRITRVSSPTQLRKDVGFIVVAVTPLT